MVRQHVEDMLFCWLCLFHCICCRFYCILFFPFISFKLFVLIREYVCFSQRWHTLQIHLRMCLLAVNACLDAVVNDKLSHITFTTECGSASTVCSMYSICSWRLVTSLESHRYGKIKCDSHEVVADWANGVFSFIPTNLWIWRHKKRENTLCNSIWH